MKNTSSGLQPAVYGGHLARAARHLRIVTLIREFNTAVACPGGARRARTILERTIEALGAEVPRSELLSQAAQSACAEPERRVHAKILQELKAVQQLWSATETDTVRSEFAHAMDSLLMYQVRAGGNAEENLDVLTEKLF